MSGIDAEIPEAKSTLPEPETNVQQMRTQINGYNLPRFRKLVPFAFFSLLSRVSVVLSIWEALRPHEDEF